MAYRFTEYGGRRFVAWEDLELVLDGLTIYLRDKTEPEVQTEHHELDIYVKNSYMNRTLDGNTFKELKTWLVPARKRLMQIPGLSFIWCPLTPTDG